MTWRFIMQAEVDFLGQLHHPNLVKLIGYCIEDDQRLLVYEFMTRGSLENHLFRSESSASLLKYHMLISSFFLGQFISSYLLLEEHKPLNCYK